MGSGGHPAVVIGQIVWIDDVLLYHQRSQIDSSREVVESDVASRANDDQVFPAIRPAMWLPEGAEMVGFGIAAIREFQDQPADLALILVEALKPLRERSVADDPGNEDRSTIRQHWISQIRSDRGLELPIARNL